METGLYTVLPSFTPVMGRRQTITSSLQQYNKNIKSSFIWICCLKSQFDHLFLILIAAVLCRTGFLFIVLTASHIIMGKTEVLGTSLTTLFTGYPLTASINTVNPDSHLAV